MRIRPRGKSPTRLRQEIRPHAMRVRILGAAITATTLALEDPSFGALAPLQRLTSPCQKRDSGRHARRRQNNQSLPHLGRQATHKHRQTMLRQQWPRHLGSPHSPHASWPIGPCSALNAALIQHQIGSSSYPTMGSIGACAVERLSKIWPIRPKARRTYWLRAPSAHTNECDMQHAACMRGAPTLPICATYRDETWMCPLSRWHVLLIDPPTRRREYASTEHPQRRSVRRSA